MRGDLSKLPPRLSTKQWRVNSLIILPEELYSDCSTTIVSATIVGQRANDVQSRHHFEVGRQTRIGVLGARRGHAVVRELAPERIVLDLELDTEPLARSNTHLIVAVSRPPTIRKIIQAATLCGIQSLSIVRAERTEKSYLDSDHLKAESILAEKILALEQACDSIPPQIAVHSRFKPFIFDQLAPILRTKNTAPLCLCADGIAPSQSDLSYFRLDSPQQDVYIAIGPELGWNEFERDCFFQVGFRLLSLGPRTLRVEHAAYFAMAQVELLRGLAR